MNGFQPGFNMVYTSFFKWYIRGYRDPHKCFRVLRRAAVLNGISIVRVPMHVPVGAASLGGARLWKFLGHVILLIRLYLSPSRNIMVREFLTIPLAVISPFLWCFKDRVWFLCNHNLARTRQRSAERCVFKIMVRMGFRFLVLEEADWAEAKELGLVEGQLVVLRAPCERRAQAQSRVSNRVVGVVGNYRAEKSANEILDRLIQVKKTGIIGQFDLLIGSTRLENYSKYAPDCILVNTSSDIQYANVLSRCDAVLIPYDPISYRMRVSGVVIDAVGFGCSIVASGVSTLKKQISEPVSVGYSFDSVDGLAEAIRQALELRAKLGWTDRLEEYYAGRGVLYYQKTFSFLWPSARAGRLNAI